MPTWDQFIQEPDFINSLHASIEPKIRADLIDPLIEAVRALRAEVGQLRSRVEDDLATKGRNLEARVALLENACGELLTEARQARGERVDEATDHSGPARLDVPNPGIV